MCRELRRSGKSRACGCLPDQDRSTVEEDFATAFFDHGLGEFEAGDFVVDEIKRERFFRQLREWRDGGWQRPRFLQQRRRNRAPARSRAAGGSRRAPLHHRHARARFHLPRGERSRCSATRSLFGRYRNTRARRLALRRAREQASRAQIDFSELERGRSRGPPRARHRPLRRDEDGSRSGNGAARKCSSSPSPTTRGSTCRWSRAISSRATSASENGIRRSRRSATANGRRRRRTRRKRSSITPRKLLAGPRRARDRGRLCLSAGQQMAARVRGVVSLQGNARSNHRDRRDQGRHGERAADGSAHLRRRGLRQNRGRDPRGVQGGDGRQASRDPRSDDGPRRAALPQLFASGCSDYPVTVELAQPLSHAGRSSARPWKGCATGAWTSSSARTG